MKVKTVHSLAVFSPVTIQITFETAQELKMFVDTMGFNESIPEMVTKWNDNKVERYKLCQDMLTELHEQARNAYSVSLK